MDMWLDLPEFSHDILIYLPFLFKFHLQFMF
jgi:hypothetical protein